MAIHRITTAIVFSAVWALASCGAQDPAPAQSSQPSLAKVPTSKPSSLHAPLDALLGEFVRGQNIDYPALRVRGWDRLTGYLAALAATDPAELPRDERLAYYINLYNASMIREVGLRLRPGYSPSENDWGVFEEPVVVVGDAKFSLNHLENEIIRPEFGEPRIHVALVCAAASCPPILPRAYEAADLDEVLEANMKRFVVDRQRNQIDDQRVAVSQIFNWYKVDFGGDEGLPKYLARYTGRDLGGRTIEFLEYSWELNLAKPEGRWVAVGDDGAERRAEPGAAASGRVKAGEIVPVREEKGDLLRVELPFGGGETWIDASATVPYVG